MMIDILTAFPMRKRWIMGLNSNDALARARLYFARTVVWQKGGLDHEDIESEDINNSSNDGGRGMCLGGSLTDVPRG